MMSFCAQRTGHEEGSHFYRVILDGGDRLAFVVLDLQQMEIFPSTPEGRPIGDVDAPNAVLSQLRRDEFALISSIIRRQWRKDGEPPSQVVKYYG